MTKKKNDNERYLVEYVANCKKTAEDATRDIRSEWSDLWQAYQNKQAWNKKSWQAKVFVPKLWMKVEKAAGEIKRAMMDIDRLWKFELDDDYAEDLDQQQRIEEEKKMRVLEKRFKNRLKKTNLSSVYSECAKSGFITGLGVPKVLWENGAKYENVDCSKTYIDPDYQYNGQRPEYFIEEQEISLAKLRKLAREVNEKAGQDVYDIDKIDKIEGDFAKDEKEQEEKDRRGLSDTKKIKKRVELIQFWGDIIDKDGKEVEENQLIVVANGKYVIRKQNNPFIHGNTPYPLLIPIVYPHRGCTGISLIGPSLPLQKTYNNVMCMVIDNANWVINKLFTCNTNRLLNPKEMFNVFPGKIIPTNSDGEALAQVGVSSIPREMFLLLSMIKQEIEEGTAVTEFLSGMPSDKAKTLGEIQIKTQESRGLFDTIARDMEQNSIKPILSLTYSLYQQFEDFPDIQGKYVFVVGGLSILLMQKDQAETMGKIIKDSTENPELRQRTDVDVLWQKLLGVLNLSDVYQEPPQQPQMPDENSLNAVRAKAIQDAQNQLMPQNAMENPQAMANMRIA